MRKATPWRSRLAVLTGGLQRVDPGMWLAIWPAFFIIQPLLQPGWPGTADTPIHFYRALEFARTLAGAVSIPRWAADLAYGYGLPLWIFVPPLPYAVPLAFQALGLSLEASLKFTIVLSALGYGLGAHLWVRELLGAKAAWLAAFAYALAPFALREVLLYGGNYPQYIAIGLFPWLLWAIGRAQRQARWLNVWLVAVCYGAVILSHLFHALVITPVAIMYAGVLWASRRRSRRSLAASGLGLLLGLGWTAFFWLPALVERSWTRAVEAVYVDVSPFYLRFLDWHELVAAPQPLDAGAANPWVPFSLGPAILVLAALGVLAIARHWRRRELLLPGMFCLCLLAACTFMMLPASYGLWNDIPLLAVAEFPWRLLGLANLGLAFLAGSSAWLFSGRLGCEPPAPGSTGSACHPRSARLQSGWCTCGALAVLFGSAVYLYPFRPFVHYGESPAAMASYELATHTVGTTTLGEYLPAWVTKIPGHLPLAEALSRGELPDRLDRRSLPPGASAATLDASPVEFGYRLDSPQPFQARLLSYYFPGWQAYLDEQLLDITIEPRSGFIVVAVPAGTHELQLRFGNTPLRRASNLAAALAVASLPAIPLWQFGRRWWGRGAAPARARAGGATGDSLPAPVMSQTPGRIANPVGRAAAWDWRTAGWLSLGLLGLLTIKAMVVDPHTGWFRRASPPAQVIGAQHPLHINLDNRFWLLGYDVSADQVSQGATLRVVLYWQAQAATQVNYRSFVHLDAPADQRTWAASDHVHPGDPTAQIELPTATWDTARYVRDVHVLSVPAGLPPASFNLRAGLYDPAGGRRVPFAGGATDTFTLQSVQVTPGTGIRRADLANPVDYRLGQQVRLVGYDWDGARASLTLYWEAGQPVSADAVVFVHLLNEHGQLAWGADAPPLDNLYPLSAWRPDEIVADPRPLDVSRVPPGEYTLAVGMYDPTSMVRWPVVDGRGQPIPDNSIRLLQLSLP